MKQFQASFLYFPVGTLLAPSFATIIVAPVLTRVTWNIAVLAICSLKQGLFLYTMVTLSAKDDCLGAEEINAGQAGV